MDFKTNNECALNIKSDICSSDEIIDKMRDFLKKNTYKSNLTNKKEVIEEVKTVMGCESELCVVKELNVPSDVINTLFKTIGPSDSTQWLSDNNIDSVLSQIAKAHHDFLHIPFQMRDFNDMQTELANLDFYSKYQQGFRTFGCVINTDVSSGSGIHWFSIFGDFKKVPYTIEYFNSSGELPLDEIRLWMKKIKYELISKFEIGEVQDITVSRIRHQQSNTECGVYSLFYIISRLSGVPFNYFGQNRIPDELMYDFRKYLFRS